MTNETPAHEPQRSESPFSFTEEGLQVSESKVRRLCVDRFSERESSRHLAAVCKLLILALSRDFGVPTPDSITIVPSKPARGVELRIIGRD
ncbi:MAG: hypothetical protein ACFFCH_06835 [Promethearchaeota archaeon]